MFHFSDDIEYFAGMNKLGYFQYIFINIENVIFYHAWIFGLVFFCFVKNQNI